MCKDEQGEFTRTTGTSVRSSVRTQLQTLPCCGQMQTSGASTNTDTCASPIMLVSLLHKMGLNAKHAHVHLAQKFRALYNVLSCILGPCANTLSMLSIREQATRFPFPLYLAQSSGHNRTNGTYSSAIDTRRRAESPPTDSTTNILLRL